jgi:hypothetical protein
MSAIIFPPLFPQASQKQQSSGSERREQTHFSLLEIQFQAFLFIMEI